MKTPSSAGPRARAASLGFTLVEMMIAMAIALFLIAGMAAVLANVRSTYGAQTKLAALEDNQRLAMMLMADVIESAGYFPIDPPINPLTNTAAAAMPASNNFPGQAGSPSVIGTTDANGNDIITVRFAAPPGDTSLMDCMGQTNTNVAPSIDYENTFSEDASGNLTCTVTNGATNAAVAPPAILVPGLSTGGGIQIWYGVSTGTASGGTCVDTYMTAAQVTAANDWGVVCSVKVKLTFPNPVPAPGAQAPITFTRVIAVMNAA
ncbi:MAG: prepilin-type N-terminal cleavage/methylation domain-containing protein [Steroidobacteraceae bacterium]